MKYASAICILVAAPAFAEFGHELRAIAMVESQNGKYLNHAVVKRGPHRNTRAGGYYGLMPRTAKELISQSERLYAKYGEWIYASEDDLTEELNTNREMDLDLAIYMWKRLRKTMPPEKAACSWFWGPAHSRCVTGNYESEAYVQKFKNFLDTL